MDFISTESPFFQIFIFFVSLSLCSCLSLREDNLVHKEKYHHRYTTIQHCSSDIVQPVRYKHSCYCDPNAINGIYNTGNNTECDQVPSPDWCREGVCRMDILSSFLLSILASVIAYYICKWLDRK